MKFRVGFGYDVHRLEEGRDLWLGGILIPHTKGNVAHSDGDCLIHAICDALLGAVNLRDIGFHFPDTSEKYKSIDSKILLSETLSLIKNKNYNISNIDSTICLQEPKIKQFIPEMIKTLAKILTISEEDISIKATTTERLGFVGAEEGIACYAVVSVYND